MQAARGRAEDFADQVRGRSGGRWRSKTPTAGIRGGVRKGELVNVVSGELTFEWNTLLPIVKKTSG